MGHTMATPYHRVIIGLEWSTQKTTPKNNLEDILL